MKTFHLSLCLAALYALTLLRPDPARAYPLDGYASTGIGRLEAARLVAYTVVVIRAYRGVELAL